MPHLGRYSPYVHRVVFVWNDCITIAGINAAPQEALSRIPRNPNKPLYTSIIVLFIDDAPEVPARYTWYLMDTLLCSPLYLLHNIFPTAKRIL